VFGRRRYERFYIANIDLAPAILCINYYLKSKIGGSLFDEEIDLPLHLRELTD